MLKDMSAGVNRLLTGLRPRPGVKRVNLALQGGGAHGAFTWGVLDHLLEDGRLAFSGVSGASAGAINAVMLADGLARGGPEEARKRLAEFWRARLASAAILPGPQRAVLDRMLSLFPAGGSPVQMFVDADVADDEPVRFQPAQHQSAEGPDRALRRFRRDPQFRAAWNCSSPRPMCIAAGCACSGARTSPPMW